jgi:phenylacetate-CoA ligase
MGCTVVPVSSGQSARQVVLLRDLGAEVLCCTPSYAARLGEVLVEETVDLGELRLRAGIFGAEPWSEAMRAKIEALLGLKALDIYGLSEVIGPGVACECVEGRTTLPESPTEGVNCTLHVNEDHFLVEVIDPATGAPVPPRTYGELVFTTLTREAMPVLRYRTGDIAAIDSGPCVCGRTLVRMSKVVGRADDMLVIRGVNVYPSEVEAVLLAEPAVGAQYLLVVDRIATMPSLVVVCELAEVAAGGEEHRDQTRASIAAALERRLALRPEVHVLPPGTLPRTEVGKAQRVVQRTPDQDPLQGLVR